MIACLSFHWRCVLRHFCPVAEINFFSVFARLVTQVLRRFFFLNFFHAFSLAPYLLLHWLTYYWACFPLKNVTGGYERTARESMGWTGSFDLSYCSWSLFNCHLLQLLFVVHRSARLWWWDGGGKSQRDYWLVERFLNVVPEKKTCHNSWIHLKVRQHGAVLKRVS